MKTIVSILLFLSIHIFSTPLHSHINDFETPIVDYLQPVGITELSSGIDSIDCIYVINLDQRPEKWSRTKQLFDLQGVRVNRVSAINGWDLSEESLKELCGPFPVRLKGGEYGHLLSYLSVLKDAYDRNFNCIWICEDHVEFFDDIHQLPLLLNSLAQFDPEWDIFYTDIGPRVPSPSHIKHLQSNTYDPRPGQNLPSLDYYQKKFRVDDAIMKIRQRHGIHSALISRQGIKKILEYFTHVFVWSALDVDIHYIPRIREYGARRDIVSSWAGGRSDRQTPLIPIDPEKEKEAHELMKLAQNYQAENNYERALECYQRRVGMGGDNTQVFWALYQIGCLQQSLQMDPEIFIDSLKKAYHHSSLRAEPLYRLALYFHNAGNYNLGYLIARLGITHPFPADSSYVEAWIYQWGMLMEYSLTAYYSGRYDEFKHACDQMLADPLLPAHVRKCVEDNVALVNIILPSTKEN